MALARFFEGGSMAKLPSILGNHSNLPNVSSAGGVYPETIAQIESETFAQLRAACAPIEPGVSPATWLAGAALTAGFILVLPFIIAGIAGALL